MNIYKFREINEASIRTAYRSLLTKENKNQNRTITYFDSNLERIFSELSADRPQLNKLLDFRDVQDALKTATSNQRLAGNIKKIKRKIGLQGNKIRVFNGKPMLDSSTLPPGARLNQAGFTSLTGLSKKEKSNFKIMADYIYDGAFVGANVKKPIDIIEGRHGAAWSAATNWQDITGIQPETGEPIGKCLYI